MPVSVSAPRDQIGSAGLSSSSVIFLRRERVLGGLDLGADVATATISERASDRRAEPAGRLPVVAGRQWRQCSAFFPLTKPSAARRDGDYRRRQWGVRPGRLRPDPRPGQAGSGCSPATKWGLLQEMEERVAVPPKRDRRVARWPCPSPRGLFGVRSLRVRRQRCRLRRAAQGRAPSSSSEPRSSAVSR
jgi:hypothetical protein